ncbi:MAG: shikimate dehydrogenase [Chitinispirillales bacterium]|nr:shikimate dehydrogenase [Chitinispirillales bacterium]
MEFSVTGRTKTVCLLGYPVAHSISPQIHNRAFRELGLPYVYIPLSVSPKNLHSAIFTLREGMAGANVTIPHKEAALRFCDEVSELSMITGTVNTLYMRDGRLCGTTTDPIGFYRALEAAGHVFGGDDVVILGNGGTARTLGAALLLDKKCRSLTIAARSAQKAAALVSPLGEIGTIPVGYCLLGSPDSKDIFARCSLLINCTSAGMRPDVDNTPLDKSFFHPGMTVFDAIYNPAVTRLLREAAEAGCKTQNGLLMLLHQGLESFRYWTGVDAPADIFDEALLRSFVDNYTPETQ